MSNNISFTVDILKEVSKEYDIPLEKVKYSFDIMLRNIDNLVRNTDTTSIFVHKIGTLYLNYERLKVFKKSLDSRDKNTDVINSKLEKMEEHLRSVEKRKKNYYVNRHLQKTFLNNKFFSKGLSIEEIEKMQNDETGI